MTRDFDFAARHRSERMTALAQLILTELNLVSIPE